MIGPRALSYPLYYSLPVLRLVSFPQGADRAEGRIVVDSLQQHGKVGDVGLVLMGNNSDSDWRDPGTASAQAED